MSELKATLIIKGNPPSNLAISLQDIGGIKLRTPSGQLRLSPSQTLHLTDWLYDNAETIKEKTGKFIQRTAVAKTKPRPAEPTPNKGRSE